MIMVIMSKLSSLRLFIGVVLLVGCASTQEPSPHRVGSSFGGPVWRGPLNPITSTASATAVVFDTTVTPIVPLPERLVVTCRFDQGVTILYQIQRIGSSTWRTMNGVGDVVPANTDAIYDYLIQGPSSRIEVVNGGTGPSTPEFNVAPVYDRPLAM